MNNEIIKKLNIFIRKYYKNLVIRGFVYVFLLLIILFLCLSIIEYFGWNSTTFRTIIFYTYILLACGIAIYWIIIPLCKLLKIGRTLSYEEAAKIIGNHFPQIKDKLLNLLQLQEIQYSKEKSLLQAAIEQKTSLLSPIPFVKAVDTTKTKKFSKYLIVVILIVVAIGLSFPKLLSEPSKRYIHHSTFFEKPAPFEFILQSPQSAVQQTDYEIKVSVKGKILPEKVNVIVGGQTFEMKQKDKTHFTYIISQIQKTTSVQFEAADFYSKIYNIKVNPKPIVTELSAEIIYPAYTKMQKEIVNNVTDLSVPKGTKINWLIRTRNCEKVIFSSLSNKTTTENIKSKNLVQKNSASYKPNSSGEVKFQNVLLHSQDIAISSQNSFTHSTDSIAFAINVVEDERPAISVIEQRDSLIAEDIYFRGQIKDDYGFSKLEFVLNIKPKNSNIAKVYKKQLNINNGESAQEFYHSENLNEYNIQAGDEITYYFQVWDNDAINGAKSSKSEIFKVSMPTENEVENKVQTNSNEIKQQANDAINEITKLQNEINELTKKLTQKKELSWQDMKDLQTLQQKQSEVQEKVYQIQEKIQENSRMEDKYMNVDEELMEKQRQIEELFNQLKNKDLENLMKQMNELMQKQINKDQLNESLKQIRDKNEDISKQLDRNLEMYKRLDVEKDINQSIEKLKELSKKQEELSKQTQNAKNDKQTKDELLKKQEELNKEFKDLQKKLEETQKKDSQLENPFNFKRNQQEEQEISQNQKQAQENISKNKNKNASSNQKQAAEKMQKMSEQMEENQQENEQEQLAEDIDNVKQILKNLVTLSKKQESLILDMQQTSVSDPSYQKIINSENTIKESMQTISDSLYQISKRQMQVSKTINDETFKVQNNIEQSINNLLRFNQSIYTSYHNTQASRTARYAMSSMNNLALLLAESLDNMNKQQSMSKSRSKSKSSKMCNNPSQSMQGRDPKNMRELQQALNKEIQRLQKELQKRGNQSKQKIGENSALNEQLARAAAQQEMIRKMMQEYIQQLKAESGKNAGNLNKLLKQMEDTEKDIVNKRINNQTISRQNQILTRMLESERAEKKKDKENKRESKTGVDKTSQTTKNFEAFNKLKNRDMELFRKIPAVYSSYYKTKINEYFLNFEVSNAKRK